MTTLDLADALGRRGRLGTVRLGVEAGAVAEGLDEKRGVGVVVIADLEEPGIAVRAVDALAAAGVDGAERAVAEDCCGSLQRKIAAETATAIEAIDAGAAGIGGMAQHPAGCLADGDALDGKRLGMAAAEVVLGIVRPPPSTAPVPVADKVKVVPATAGAAMNGHTASDTAAQTSRKALVADSATLPDPIPCEMITDRGNRRMKGTRLDTTGTPAPALPSS